MYLFECRVPKNSRGDKAFLSDQCKEYRKTIELERLEISSRKFDMKGTFHAKVGTIKDRNNLTEREDINMWKEYTEELYRRDVHDVDNHDGVIIHLESDILECKVRWALGSFTVNKEEMMEF